MGDNNEFISQWDQYSKEMKNIQKIKLQQEVGNKKKAKYLSQHSCYKMNLSLFSKKKEDRRIFPEVEMRVRQLGGYTPLQVQSNRNSKTNESKVFVFMNGYETDMNSCRQLSHYRFLNIYKAYFESSNYDYILEFLVDNDHNTEFMDQLKTQTGHFESGIYKECVLQAV
jgi:hypothetical protein